MDLITVLAKDVWTCMHACIHTYIHTYLHTYAHTHTYMHRYIHTYIPQLVVCSRHWNTDLG
jgi:hypothetical protein